MTYSGEVFDASSAIAVEVIDSSGANVALTPPVVADTTVTQAVKPVTSPGVVTVRWRVVSSDGHPISGEYAFTVDAPVTPTASAEPDPSATTGAPSSSEQSPAISSTPEQSATADAVAEVEEPPAPAAKLPAAGLQTPPPAPPPVQAETQPVQVETPPADPTPKMRKSGEW